MNTIIRISEDYMCSISHDQFIDEIDYLVNEEIEVFCEVKNDRLINVIEEQKRYLSGKESFKNKCVVTATGYSQSDWQEYVIYHNEDEYSLSLQRLKDELKKTFTHMNDYAVEKFERTVINGKKFDAEPHDFTHFSIRHIEFPDKDDVLKEYLDIYGKDFDEVEFNLNN